MSVLYVKGVRSYSAENDVEFDISAKVTLIYGQNGCGKSTVSGYFYKPTDSQYKDCRIVSEPDLDYLVFNQDYIDETFHQNNIQPGIFTLNSENAAIQEAIDENVRKIKSNNREIDNLQSSNSEKESMIDSVKSTCVDKIWDKSAHVRKSSITSLVTWMGRKQKFFDAISKHTQKEELTLEELCERYSSLQENKDTKYNIITPPNLPFLDEKEISILKSPLLTSSDSQLSDVISRLGNGDWVRRGEKYLSDNCCPFCQQHIDTESFKQELNKLFDESYNQGLQSIRDIMFKYAKWLDEMQSLRKQLELLDYINQDHTCYNSIIVVENLYSKNADKMEGKLLSPSIVVELEDVSSALSKLKSDIFDINSQVEIHNDKVDNYQEKCTLLEYNLLSYLNFLNNDNFIQLSEQLKEINDFIELNKQRICSLLEDNIRLNDDNKSNSDKVVNIEDTIIKINSSLISLGVTGFEIVRHEPEKENYRLAREGNDSTKNIFKSLSEGEKTLISFLYFIEKCTGRVNKDDVIKDKMIIIDDPISSLSQNFIYEVSSMIYNDLISKDVAKKYLILTHNLFFFQELIINANAERNVFKNWNLFRITKNKFSECHEIGKDDVLNEYQSLWQTLKDAKIGVVNSVILPNVMRNILEYYFSFSCKKEKLRDVLKDLAKENADQRYNSFYRFINRHSHSDGRNIVNVGAIDATTYLEMFERIFISTSDHEHYLAMMGIELSPEEMA